MHSALRLDLSRDLGRAACRGHQRRRQGTGVAQTGHCQNLLRQRQARLRAKATDLGPALYVAEIQRRTQALRQLLSVVIRPKVHEK